MLERWLGMARKKCMQFWTHYPIMHLCHVQEPGRGWRWASVQNPTLGGEPSTVKGFVEQTEPQTPWAAVTKQVAFRKGVVYEEGPRFVGGPHLEQLADELSLMGGGDARNLGHGGLQMGLGREWGRGCV